MSIVSPVQNADVSGFVIKDPVYDDDTLVFTGADTLAEGTILGRITASKKLTFYASGAADGSEIPVAILPQEIVAAGAGDIETRVLVSGEVKQEKLVEDGVGTGITDAALKDQLRDYGIIALSVTERNFQDNQ